MAPKKLVKQKSALMLFAMLFAMFFCDAFCHVFLFF